MVNEPAPAILAGRHGAYAIEAEHGHGTFGVTYRGRRASDGLAVAVKVLRLGRLRDWNTFDRFEREAAVLRGLDHPAVPAWLDHFPVGDPEAPEGFALVQTFIEGRTLADVMRTPGALSWDDMLGWFDQLLEVLAYLHARVPPVIHRDVTPKNVILRPDGGVALVDFGSVQAAVEREGVMPMTSAGTFGYAAPEQLLGRATPASDIYGAAMTFLAVATGRQPTQMPVDGARVDVATLLGARDGLAALLSRMTEVDPRARIDDAAVARRRLAAVRDVGGGRGELEPSWPSPVPRVHAGMLGEELRQRLMRADFVIESGGSVEHTALAFRARREAQRFERLPRFYIYAAPASALEGHTGAGPVSAPPVTLFARAAARQHEKEERWLDGLFGTPPTTVVALIAGDDGMAPHAAARVEAALFGQGAPVPVAAVLSPRGIELMAPADAWGSAHAVVKAYLVVLLGNVAGVSAEPADS